jgi:hypothetical protein
VERVGKQAEKVPKNKQKRSTEKHHKLCTKTVDFWSHFGIQKAPKIKGKIASIFVWFFGWGYQLRGAKTVASRGQGGVRGGTGLTYLPVTCN